MTEEYAEYLNSDDWKAKRLKRLAISKFRCCACGSSNAMHVHHLTYQRIFNENMDDLLPLCSDHHKVAERLVKKGLLNRNGEVLFLATETIRLILKHQDYHKPDRSAVTSKPFKGDSDINIETRNPMQEKLISDQRFLDAIKLSRKAFKKKIQKTFSKYSNFCKISANCFTLYDRLKRSEQ